jgi:hypothetical protein
VIKAFGYLISTLSVILLGVVAWAGADEGWMRILVVLGALTSIAGMGLRWVSFERDEKPKPRSAPDRATPARPAAPEPSPPRRAHAEAERLA